MRKIMLGFMMLILVIPFTLFAKVDYLSEEEYGKLSRDERERYNQNLQNALLDYNQRKSDALMKQEQFTREIEELKGKLAKADADYKVAYAAILAHLGVTEADLATVRTKLNYFNGKIDGYEKLSDSELWSYKKQITEFISEYNEYKKSKFARIPDFKKDFSDLDRRIIGLQTTLDKAKPKYFEDNYTVVKGDYLAKIAGYDFIYGDRSKWGVIYRANRDEIRDPNVIKIDQVLKIPRGLPDSWKVYRGEYLSKIASYPEVYGNRSKWTLIYEANKDQIKDPNLIHPDQVLQLPRD